MLVVQNILGVTQSTDILIEDLTITARIFYNGYNGFLRGFYREHLPHMISTECFGAWIKGNVTQIDEVAIRIVAGEILRIEEPVMEGFATDIVNLFYLNRDKCEFDRFHSEIKEALCKSDSHCITDLLQKAPS